MNIKVEISKATVTMERVIQPGQSWRVTSSYGFAGLDSGMVKIISLNKKGDNAEVDSTILAWLDSNNGDYGMEEYNRSIEKGIWVCFKYISDGLTDTVYMPIEEFVDHISIP